MLRFLINELPRSAPVIKTPIIISVLIGADIMIGTDGLKASPVLSGCDSRDGLNCSAPTRLSLTVATLTWNSRNQTLTIYQLQKKKVDA